MTTHDRDREFKARVRAFGGPLQKHRIKVEADGTVWIWDSVGESYSLARLSEGQKRRLRRLAAEVS